MKTSMTILWSVILIVSLAVVGCDQAAPTDTQNTAVLDMTSAGVLAKGAPTATYPTDGGTGTTGSFYGDDPTHQSSMYTLYAGKTNVAGTVEIWYADDALHVLYDTDGTADLGEVHVYVWSQAPAAGTARPAPGQAPYKAENINADAYELVIPMQLNCGENVYVSTHAALIGDGTGSSTNAGETAYAGGSPFPNGKGAWWGYVTYNVSCFWDIAGSLSFIGDCGDGSTATVTLTGGPGNVSYTAAVSGAGTYAFNNLPAGTYTVTSVSDAYVVTPVMTQSVTIPTNNHDVENVNFSYVCAYDVTVSSAFVGSCVGDVAYSITGGTVPTANTDGSSTFARLAPGTYTVTATTTADVMEPVQTLEVTIGPNASVSFSFVCVMTPPPPPPPPPPVFGDCSLSQGYWFAKPGMQWTSTVTVGGFTYTEAEGEAIQSQNGSGVNQNLKHAFTQAATILLSGQRGWISPTASVWQDVAIIEVYLSQLGQPVTPTLLTSGTSVPAAVQQAAGRIGTWVDANHCPQSYE